MKTSTKITIALCAAALLSLGGWKLLDLAPGDTGSATNAYDEPTVDRPEAPELASVESETLREEAEVAEVQPVAAQDAGTAAPESPDEELVSTVRARLVDAAGRPVPGAELRSIYVDGKHRGADCLGEADEDGVARFEIPDKFMRAWRTQVFPMTFQASAPFRATTFVVSTPGWHEDTDLGDIELEPGGALQGRLVDEAGAAFAGGYVYLAQAVIAGDPDSIRIAGPDLDVRRPRVVSDATGRFEFGGAAAGTARLFAGGAGKLWTISEPLEIQSDITADAGVLVLEAIPPEELISGIVVRPNGEPAAGARVAFDKIAKGEDGFLDADAGGRFSFCPGGSARVEFVARDPKGEHSMSASVIAMRGTDDVRLVLNPRRTIRLQVTDTDEQPLAGAASMPLFADGDMFVGGGRPIPGENWTRSDASGRLELFVPAVSFRFGVSLDGYRSQRFGPYTPEDAPTELVVELVMEPRIAGRVVAYGEPAAGAKILIGKLIDGFIPLEAGFPVRFFANGNQEVVSDAEGRFACPIDPEWTHIVVLASPPDFATGEVELMVEPDEGASGVVIEVTHGGAIAGAVTPPADRDAAGLVIAASRGDGMNKSTRVGADGTYRLEGLTPGPWRVVPLLREPSREVLSVAQTPEEKEFNWNVDVVDGKTTEFDVDARSLAAAELHGTLLVNGAPAKGFTATIEVDEYVQYQDDLPIAQTSDAGTFVLQAPNGKCKLTLTGELPDGGKLEVVRRLVFAGVRVDWTEDVTLGPIDEMVDSGLEAVRLTRGSTRSGNVDAVTVKPDENGRVQCLAPVGETRIEKRATHQFGEFWQMIRKLQVAPG